MILNLKVYVKNGITCSNKQKTVIFSAFGEKFNFGLYFTENRQLWRHRDICTFLVCMERENPKLYLGTK